MVPNAIICFIGDVKVDFSFFLVPGLFIGAGRTFFSALDIPPGADTRHRGNTE